MVPKIVAVGANLESLHVLRAFKEKNLEICELFTLEPKKETKGSDYVNFRRYQKELNIPLFEIQSINSPRALERLNYLKPDYIFILGWSEIISSDVISAVKGYVVGSHPSKLPYGAGRAPVPWTILEGLDSSAVTLFKVTDRVDAGEIIHSEDFGIPSRVDASQLYMIISDKLSIAFCTVYEKLLNGAITFTPQDNAKRFVRARRFWQDGFIDFNKCAIDVDRLIRATTHPYPGAFTYYDGERVIVWSSRLCESRNYCGTPGQILKIVGSEYLVQCSDNPIWVSQLEFAQNSEKSLQPKLGYKFGIDLIYEVHRLSRKIKHLSKVGQHDV